MNIRSADLQILFLERRRGAYLVLGDLIFTFVGQLTDCKQSQGKGPEKIKISQYKNGYCNCHYYCALPLKMMVCQ